MSGERTARGVIEPGQEAVLALRPAEVVAEAPAVPEQVLIAPWGQVDSTAGRFVVDEEAARLAIEAFERHGTDLPIDYEHQSLGGAFAAPSGLAPAAGWIKSLQAVPEVGIVATVQWTDLARHQIAAGQYRYLSPVAIVRREDRRVVAFHSVALTNKPAITGMKPIVNRDIRQADRPGERPEAEEAQMDEQIERLRAVLDLDQATPPETTLVAATERIERLQQQLARQEAEELVAHAMRAGKLTEAQREWAIQLALTDRAAYEQWASTAPVVVPAGQTVPPGAGVVGEAGRAAVIATARAEFRQHRELAMLTDERAYINDALRQRGLELLAD